MSAERLPRILSTSSAEYAEIPRANSDPAGSTMLDLVAVSRGYEANLRAFDLTRSLIERTLDMGNRR